MMQWILLAALTPGGTVIPCGTKVSDILPSKTHLGGRAVRIFGYFSDPARLHAIAADIDCTYLYFDCEMSLIWNNKTIGC